MKNIVFDLGRCSLRLSAFSLAEKEELYAL